MRITKKPIAINLVPDLLPSSLITKIINPATNVKMPIIKIINVNINAIVSIIFPSFLIFSKEKAAFTLPFLFLPNQNLSRNVLILMN